MFFPSAPCGYLEEHFWSAKQMIVHRTTRATVDEGVLLDGGRDYSEGNLTVHIPGFGGSCKRYSIRYAATNGHEGSIKDECSKSKRGPRHNSIIRNFIDSGISYKYILGPMRDSLRMRNLAPDEENLFRVEIPIFCVETCSVLRLALATIIVCSGQQPLNIRWRRQRPAPTFGRAWSRDGVLDIMAGLAMLS